MPSVLVGGVSPEGERLIRTYLDKFMPNADIVALQSMGIKGKVKNQGSRADTALIIISEDLYAQCEGVADAVLQNPKTHKYSDDAGLKQFLISKFGIIDSIDANEEPAEEFEEPQEYDETPMYGEPLSPEIQSIVSSNVEDDDDLHIPVVADETEERSADSVIGELRDELIRKEAMIESLTQQLEGNGADSDVSAFIEKIRTLTEENEKLKQAQAAGDEDLYAALGKVSRAEKIIGEVDSLRAELNKERENSSAITFAKNTLESMVVELNDKIASYEAQVADAKVVREEFNKLKLEYEDKEAACRVLEEKVAELSEVLTENEHLGVQVAELEGFEVQFTETSQLLEECEKERDILKVKLDTYIENYEKLTAELAGVRDELSTAISELDEKKRELTDVWAKYNEADARVKELEGKIEELNASISSSTANNSGLTSRVEALGIEKDSLQSKLEAATASFDDLQAKYNALIEELEGTKKSLKSVQDELEIANISLNMNKEAYERTLDEKAELEKHLLDAEQRSLELANEIVSKSNEITNMGINHSEELHAKEEEIARLSSELGEAKVEVEHLSQKVVDASVSSDELSRLEADNLELRKVIAKLNSELEIKARSEAANNSAALKLEILKLKEQLEQAKTKQVDNDELSRLRSELENARDRAANLELDVQEQRDIIAEYEDNIFVKIGNSAGIKARMDAKLPLAVGTFKSKFIVTAGATNDSNLSLYSVIRKTCAKYSGKSVLIVDLNPDSFLDLEFGGITSTGDTKIEIPRGWLTAGEDFRKTLAASTQEGFKVRYLSCGHAYINTLSLLNVSWSDRLNEIDGYADIIIINVGCAGNLVSRVLLNTFQQVMPVHIIVKGTPVNLRTALLTLAGVRYADSCFVWCSEMTQSSRTLYSNLARKCKANMLNANEGMTL